MRNTQQSPKSWANQRGDTIVEVLLALAVLGAVMGSAYVVTNRNTMINRASQERLQAIKIAESQIERLKARVEENNLILKGSDTFCMDPSSDTPPSTSSTVCLVDASGQPTTGVPAYRIAISRVTPYITIEGDEMGTEFIIRVTWENVRGTTDELEYNYEIYR